MKPLVIYHADCADGFGAAFAAWLKLGDEATYRPISYGEVKTVADMNSVLSEAGIPFGEGEVYILDFSLPKDVTEWLFREVERVVWLDHHKTAFEMWCGEYRRGIRYSKNHEPHWVLLDDNKSGAYLAWEYFHPDTEVPMFIRHIDDYDRWQFKLEGTKAFNKALWSYAPWSFKQWKHWLGNNSGHHLSMVFAMREEGNAILRAHNQNVQSVVKGEGRKCCIKVVATEPTVCSEGAGEYFESLNLPGLAANCPPHLQSDVGHELANQSGTFGLLWYIDKDNRCKCSLRSNGDYDVSAIVKVLGQQFNTSGGGHKNAAGVTVPIEALLSWLS